MTAPLSSRLLQRQILPKDRDLDVLSLYVDPEEAVLDADKYEVGGTRAAKALNAAALRQATSTGAAGAIAVDQIESRQQLRLPMGQRLSFGTYFNAFPASYWRRWTVVTEVRLSVRMTGRGGTVTVYRSMANGRSQRVASRSIADGDDSENTFEFALPLKPFADGGWYWYDVIAGDADLVVHAGEWWADVPEDRLPHGTTTIGITTMNRPEFCAKLLRQIGEDEDLRPYLDQVLVVDQGSEKVAQHEIFSEAVELLGESLEVIDQANLGGSGGYARGQMETVRRGTATYFMCMDDDVVCEPEGIIRAVTFGDLARRPTIVGGHMFNLYSRSRLYSLGEIVMPWRFWWRSAPGVFQDWDFSARNLRSTRWLHMRVDADFNGWFMCLIPTRVLAEIGLSLPLFIKWDDSEFGLRAQAAGYPTVSFPGAAVWHIPWSDKNDAVDWQSYFHQRNRFVAALLQSQFPHGGKMLQESLAVQLKHLVSMQYSTAELRLLALEDVLAGPDQLHEDLATKLPQVRALMQEFTDARLDADPDAFPPARRAKPRKKNDTVEVPGLVSRLLAAGVGTLRQLTKPRELSREYPEGYLPATDARWYQLASYDSAVVTMPDGTSAAFYRRDDQQFRDLLRRTTEIHQRLYREWPRLARLYRDRLADITSPERWEQTIKAAEK